MLTAYLGAQAVCDLVFGWMVREVEAAETFEQVRSAGERYGELIGAQTARILVMVAMAAIAEGGVIARLMKLPGNAAASAALAEDAGGVGLESVPEISGAQVLQGGVTATRSSCGSTRGPPSTIACTGYTPWIPERSGSA